MEYLCICCLGEYGVAWEERRTIYNVENFECFFCVFWCGHFLKREDAYKKFVWLCAWDLSNLLFC